VPRPPVRPFLRLGALALPLAACTPSSAPGRAPAPAPYWQQAVDYAITARLDDASGVLSAEATLVYTNASPDTLRELYVHQHLNAFRPGSAWSAVDAREGRTRFQNLQEPDYAYERFTAPPTVGGRPVRVEYPGAPDSTVVRLVLAEPIAPGRRAEVRFAWDARASTVPRRQGRKGRHHDFAQWYPKMAVYDRGGWQPNALVPAGEFYGEFGDYSVTLDVAEDQVCGATGVPVIGDPGWRRANRTSAAPVLQGTAYGVQPEPRAATGGDGRKRVTFFAKDVHHFGFSCDPEYRYEGGTYVRPAGAPSMRFRTWDTVAVHVLYRPGDEATWGNGVAVQRTIDALRWLEEAFGPYGYPQVTNLHRLDGGGTEFPMLMMNGGPDFGLILHEGGHIYTYGMLANNEWRSGWMDEGFTSYQTSMRTGASKADRAAAQVARDARWLAPAMPDTVAKVWELRFAGPTAKPMGTTASGFTDFQQYNIMVYLRAEQMYGQLRDAIGDAPFRAFLRDYYATNAFRHVTVAEMRASAERAAGRPLGWFFAQWVDSTGVQRYRVEDQAVRRAGSEWVTTVRLVREGRYRHPMPVGARTATGWTIVRADAARDTQVVTLRTRERPDLVALDPLGTTEDNFAPRHRWTPPAP
jgi:hypothetical protein